MWTCCKSIFNTILNVLNFTNELHQSAYFHLLNLIVFYSWYHDKLLSYFCVYYVLVKTHMRDIDPSKRRDADTYFLCMNFTASLNFSKICIIKSIENRKR